MILKCRFLEDGTGYFLFEEFEKSSAGTMKALVEENTKKIPVARHLNESEYALLLRVYVRHNRSMGLAERGKYTLSNIVKVKRNIKERCLEVYYDNGDWWHYSVTGEWY